MRRKFYRALALVILIFASLSAVSVYAQDGQVQYEVALRDLAARLGRTITPFDISEWNFQIQLFQDRNLGCALVPSSPAPEGVPGYVLTITYENVVYDYRVSPDGSTVFPCMESMLLAPTPATGPAAGCENIAEMLPPRLRVNSNAQIAFGGEPNRLRDAPSTSANQIGTINPGRTIAVIGGPSCSEDIVWWQVAIDGTIGWTAEGLLPDQYFLEPLGVTTPVATVPALPTATIVPAATLAPQPTQAPAAVLPPALVPPYPQLAANSDAGLSLYMPGGEVGPLSVPGTNVTLYSGSSFIASQMAWSPNGQWLAYRYHDGQSPERLFVVDTSVSVNPIEIPLASRLAMPPTFTLDNLLLYGIEGDPVAVGDGPGAFMVQLFTVNPADPTGAPQPYGAFQYGVGCGGGGVFPGDFRYWLESGWSTSLGPQVMEVTPAGLLHSDGCNGVGVSLFNPATGEDALLGEFFSRAVVSQDGTRVAGVNLDMSTMPVGSALTIIDLTTLAQTPIATVERPEQIAWGYNNELFYSVRKPGLPLALPVEQAQELTNMGFPTPISLNVVSIRRVDLASQTDSEIFTAQAYAVGRMFAVPDSAPNGGLYFSLIPDGEEWYRGVASGTLDMADSTTQLEMFIVTLYAIPSGGGQARIVGSDLYEATPFVAAVGG